MISNISGTHQTGQSYGQTLTGAQGNQAEAPEYENSFTPEKLALKLILLNQPQATLKEAMDTVLFSPSTAEKEDAREKTALFLKLLGGITMPRLKTSDGSPYLLASVKRNEPNLFHQIWNHLKGKSKPTIRTFVQEQDQSGQTTLDWLALRGKTGLLQGALESGGGEGLQDEKINELYTTATTKRQTEQDFQQLLQPKPTEKKKTKSKFFIRGK